MPEYLAPGVYVEETSFRAKSIEGVSTSTTAFVGPTRRGPWFDPDSPSPTAIPELLTSFADFERIYGGLDDLSIGTNYLAHAVKGYFDNGGSRLYVSRVFMHNGSDGRAHSAPFVALPDPAEEARFVARLPGSSGNGRIQLQQVAIPATKLVADRAPQGSLLRIGAMGAAAMPARLDGSLAPPFALPASGRLLLKAGAATVPVEIKGEPVEVQGDVLATPDAIAVPAADQLLVVTIDDLPQRITIPAGPQTADQLVAAINRQLRRGYAALSADDRLILGSDRRGAEASVAVGANATLGFNPVAPATQVTAHGALDANNNVGDVSQVTVDELNHLISSATSEVRAALVADRLELTTTATGAAAEVGIADGNDDEDAVARAFGFMPGDDTHGAAGAPVSYFVKVGSSWQDMAGHAPVHDWNADGSHPDGAALLTLTVTAIDADGNQIVYEGLGFDSTHPRFVGTVLGATPSRRADALANLFAADVGAGVDGRELREMIFGASPSAIREITLTGGNDGLEPTTAAYEHALQALEQIDDISIVAAPGGSAYADAQGIMNALITHAEKRRSYRIAVLDTPPGLTLGEARDVRSRIDSSRAALYYPWVVVPNPLANPSDDTIPRELALPPSGFMCGIYARSDVQRGVFKAPANEVVLGALRFESDINFAQQEALNPLGINCLRFFPGRGYRVWGARTASSDPEWKYVNIRRYFNYLERSIDVGTQWAVFEPNGERLWANIQDTIESFLYNEWVSGALLGANPKEAFFVRCDRSTMTQNDLDNGRLICLIGVAAIKPAEFVIFRIGQKTADTRS